MNRLPPRRHRGFTLIELLIAMTIGLIVTLASMSMLAESEGRRRTQSSVTSIDESAQFISYSLGELLRNAGSGFTQSWPYTFGCKLNGRVGGSQIFPLPSLPAPFAGVAAAAGTFRLAPVLIFKNASAGGSDVLAIAEGTAGFGEIPLAFGSAPTSSALNLVGTTTLRASDLMLVADKTSSGPTACMLQQASSSFTASATTTQVALAGSYYTASGADISLSSYSADGVAMVLGNPANANPPTMTLVGIGSNNLGGTASSGSTLYRYDLLTAGGSPVAVADGVVDLRAVYGVDENGDGLPEVWRAADATGYTPAALLDGSSAAALKLLRIKAIRIGMIIRSNLAEKPDAVSGAPVAPATLSLFSDLGALAYTRTLSASDRNYRHRVIESTVPLRNLLMVAQ